MCSNFNQHICCLNSLSHVNLQKGSKQYTLSACTICIYSRKKLDKFPLQAKPIIINLSSSGANEMKVNLILNIYGNYTY